MMISHPRHRPVVAIVLLSILTAWGRAEALSVVEDDDTISVRRGESLVLAYRKTAVPLPEGVDPVFARATFTRSSLRRAASSPAFMHPTTITISACGTRG